MDHSPTDHAHTSIKLAQSSLGLVTMCPCGAITVSLQYLSLRFEPAAFRDLQILLARAQRLLDADRTTTCSRPEASPELPSMH